jgi:hypothetical protein
MIVSILEIAAWVISAGLAAWMLYDAIGVSRRYDEVFLTTSVEGTDDLFDPSAAPSEGAR